MIIAAAWTVGAQRAPSALWAAAGHVAMAAIVWVARRRQSQKPFKSVIIQRVLDVYPLALLPLLWGELGPLLPLLHQHSYDDAIMRLDARWFGIDWHTPWVMSSPRWLEELMYGAYCSFYVLLVVPAVLMLAAGERRVADLRDLVLRVMLTFMVCDLIDLWFPVIGPASDVRSVTWTHGLFFGLSAAATHVGDSLGTSFPSTHVAASTAIAWGAWHWYRRPLAAFITILVAALTVSTIYTRNHYALDAIGGLLIAALVQSVAVPFLRHALERGGNGLE